MNLRLPAIRASGDRPLTGRSVLVMLLAFFGAVMVVNVFMIRAAVSTFGGVDTPSSYKAGLAFKAEEAAAAAQAALGWTVSGRITPSGGRELVTIDILDRTGAPVARAEVTARLAHPVDERRDVAVLLAETGPGTYSGTADVGPGQWRLAIEVVRAGERVFRSENRVLVH